VHNCIRRLFYLWDHWLTHMTPSWPRWPLAGQDDHWLAKTTTGWPRWPVADPDDPWLTQIITGWQMTTGWPRWPVAGPDNYWLTQMTSGWPRWPLATLCRWRRCFVADQLWFMTRIREEEDSVGRTILHAGNDTCLIGRPIRADVDPCQRRGWCCWLESKTVQLV